MIWSKDLSDDNASNKRTHSLTKTNKNNLKSQNDFNFHSCPSLNRIAESSPNRTLNKSEDEIEDEIVSLNGLVFFQEFHE